MGKGINENLDRLISRKKLPEKSRRRVSRWNEADKRFFLREFLEKNWLSRSDLIEVIEILNDLAKMKRQKIEDLISRKSFKDVFVSPLTNKQKRDRFMSALRELRYPELTRYEKKFNEILGKFVLDPKCRINYPKFFEDEGIVLNLKIHNEHDLEECMDSLARNKKFFKELFTYLRGE